MNNMNKTLHFILAMMVSCLASAQNDGGFQQSAMRSVADKFFQDIHLHESLPSVTSKMESKVLSSDGQPSWYAYNYGSNEGFVLVVPNGGTPVVAGYSEKGCLSDSTLSPTLRQLLREIGQQPLPQTSSPAITGQAVAPLLGNIEWGQGAPYNILSPVGRFSFTGERSAVGCVAVSMGQVMYYHRWPIHGLGEHTIKYTDLYADFASTTYEWDWMRPRLDAQSDPRSINAVATLLLHAGISVDMDYGEASGAQQTDVAPALANYFNYDKGISYRSRKFYTDSEWQQLLSDELTAGRPVIYGGFTCYPESGHSFVCDGSDGKGYYHINWGWDGDDNGYYLLSALDPPTLVEDGMQEGEGFKHRSDMIIGIQPPREDSKTHYELCGWSLPEQNHVEASLGSTIELAIVFNDFTLAGKPYKFYFAFIDPQTGETVAESIPKAPERHKGAIGYIFSQLPLPADLSDGDYRAKLCYVVEDDAVADTVRIAPDGISEYRIHVEEGKAWVDGTHQVRLSLAGIVGGVIQSGGHSKVSLEIKNEGDTHMSDLLFRLKNPDTQLQYTSPFVGFAELPAGTTTTIDWDANVQLPAADNYILDLIDVESYVTLASLKNVSVEGTPTAPVLALENTPIAGSEDMKFHRNDLCLTINVMNYGTTYQGDIVLRSDDYMSGLNVEVGRQQVNLPPGKSTFDFHCDASDSGMKIGKVYECRLYEGDKPMQPYDLSKFSIPLSDDVNIGISETFMNPNVVSFYDIQGRRLQGKGSRGIRIACLSDGTTIKIED